MNSLITVTLAIILGFISLSTHAASVPVVNGSMNVAGGANVQTFNAVQPDGWADIDISTSTVIFDVTTSFNGFTWNASSDGGTFVHAIGPISVIPGEGIVQAISGLAIGTTYQVNFEQSISRSTNAPQGTGGHWEVVFGAETKQSTFMVNPALKG